ncbi:hypothetical protein BTURTLESOX_1371 [bacterium endosymbiont of Bathymodiolus sp. 5 South]|nr:hypothetical protein [uncultured Gammaproteobacteria bacterium]SHN90325.1 hypothetical protein BCLUESOX_389 [bacterium endosymbiont of Bathymodiolus sp. 5 South]SSC08834.1 hypothetical protein BTURTLESOX_1371 [bacterium endosymbiont of Bathymodiolus sp. 5 South]VVH57778.1 hypothetical protein BSPCLSOX_1082 [uncultured Gammaproteobacteria bacterium]VVH62399.1 hypothetical protein BSPWISOX_1106 [uncultured Gammaproteobacteria bacterium]
MRKKPKGKAMSHWNKMCNKAINKRLIASLLEIRVSLT